MAGIGSRFLAVLTDSIIQFVAVIVTILLFVVVGARSGSWRRCGW